MSSSDGFCSTLSFAPGELGQIYTGSTSAASNHASSATPSANVTPLPTPTHAPSPLKPSPVPASGGGSATPAPLSTSHVPPASPARSNSACSVATQSSNQQTAAVVNNPTPTLGSVPLVTATHSAQPSTLPLTTPPQTPLSTSSHGGISATTGSVLGKRDARTASESEKEESKGSDSGATSQQPKKRRIAPTLVSASVDSTSSSKDGSRPETSS